MSNHQRLEEDVVHMRLTRSELEVLRAVLEVGCDCPDEDMHARIAALNDRLRQLQEALG